VPPPRCGEINSSSGESAAWRGRRIRRHRRGAASWSYGPACPTDRRRRQRAPDRIGALSRAPGAMVMDHCRLSPARASAAAPTNRLRPVPSCSIESDGRRLVPATACVEQELAADGKAVSAAIAASGNAWRKPQQRASRHKARRSIGRLRGQVREVDAPVDQLVIARSSRSVVGPISSITSPSRRQLVTCDSAANSVSSPLWRSGVHCARSRLARQRS